jgi:uncharacterized membrane protein YjgN (DUF898 family)
MDTPKPIKFNGTAGGFFVVSVVSLVCTYIPWFGWAFMLNYIAEWFADSSLVNGKKVVYKASYGETLKFVFVQSLLLLVTLGFYIFWFQPKLYRYVVDHTSYADEAATEPVPVADAAAVASPVEPPVEPVVPPAPTAPTVS